MLRATSNQKLWKMDTNDPYIVQKQHKDLEYKAKALLANEQSIFRPLAKKQS